MFLSFWVFLCFAFCSPSSFFIFITSFSTLSINASGDEWDTLPSQPMPSGSSTSASWSSGVHREGGKGWENLFFAFQESSMLCLGLISGSKFCVKECTDGKSCGIPTRKTKVDSNKIYILETESKVFFLKHVESNSCNRENQRGFPQDLNPGNWV